MDDRILHKYKWFWAWDDEKEEAWLSKMAHDGWHLQSLGLPGSYTFAAGEPREDVYRMDYIIQGKDYQHYLQLFRDAGWEHIGVLGGWQYFRTRKQGSQMPEIYTDNASKAQKYSRVLVFLVVFLPIFTMTVTRPVSTESSYYDFFSIIKVIMSLFMVLYAYAMVRLVMRINRLKK
jgi:hypothetical protein